MILNHPDVIGFLFVHEGKLIKAYLPKKVVSFQATTSEDRKSVVAVSGTCSEYTPFSVSEEILLRDVYHITNCDKFIKTFPTSSTKRFAKESSPTFQKSTKRSTKQKKLLWVACRTFFLSLQEIQLEKGESMKIGPTTKISLEKSIKPTYFLKSIWD